ncbi:BRCA1 C terminus domain-containing protein [Xylaria bambusicola]|uniref:BRCA1 C terminus domain-containing protein n=1 Tax=Xylaria bambusicola TaxID=326684 RepID=UPI002007B390|nr:BRCA1 C terminus domain-containing protein [Xylaria bambusicola]KAI0509419.1 BRCA1 C terminus domain-containing protein [Xylaria bambusicola]
MPPSKPPVPRAAEPIYGQSFDPWNSSSTGHQRAENRLGGSTGWRDSRNRKLMSQFTGGAGGGKRVSDTVGEGSQDWDPKAKALITPEMRSRAQSSVFDMLANPGSMKPSSYSSGSAPAPPSLMTSNSASFSNFGESASKKPGPSDSMTAEERLMLQRKEEDDAREQAKQPRGIFDGVVVYLNGSTHPLISDHKLKHVLAEHGGSMSSHLGRRKVTHVILGRPAAGGYGAGGGLAGGKLQREISKMSGPAVKFVGVQWVLESIKAGKRLPEARFADLKIAARGQQSVYGLYSRQKDTTSADVDESQPPPSAQPR